MTFNFWSSKLHNFLHNDGLLTRFLKNKPKPNQLLLFGKKAYPIVGRDHFFVFFPN